MRILVCGDRGWTDSEFIYKILEKEASDTVIIHGAARGADSLAGYAALKLGFKIESYPADWKTYGRAAGPIRNRQMLLMGKPHQVFAFHDDIENSKGTKDMMKQAEKAGLLVTLYSHPVYYVPNEPEA